MSTYITKILKTGLEIVRPMTTPTPSPNLRRNHFSDAAGFDKPIIDGGGGGTQYKTGEKQKIQTRNDLILPAP